MQTSREIARHNDTTQCYAFSSKTEAKAFDGEIVCTILVCDRITNMLFDLSSTYFYEFVRFASAFSVICDT